jgi:hypothetical protein
MNDKHNQGVVNISELYPISSIRASHPDFLSPKALAGANSNDAAHIENIWCCRVQK